MSTAQQSVSPDIRTEGSGANSPTTAQWYSMYSTAMWETDRGKTLFQIERAQKAIQERVLELRYLPPSNVREVHDLGYASTHLEILLQCLGNENGGLLWD
jgi:hypothetical protein